MRPQGSYIEMDPKEVARACEAVVQGIKDTRAARREAEIERLMKPRTFLWLFKLRGATRAEAERITADAWEYPSLWAWAEYQLEHCETLMRQAQRAAREGRDIMLVSTYSFDQFEHQL